jgi:hypothetical protein
VLCERMIEEDFSRVRESATKSTYILDVGFERYEDKGEKSALKFIPSSTYHKEKQQSSSLTTHPTQSHPSTQIEKQGKNPLSRERKLLFTCFVAVLVT